MRWRPPQRRRVEMLVKSLIKMVPFARCWPGNWTIIGSSFHPFLPFSRVYSVVHRDQVDCYITTLGVETYTFYPCISGGYEFSELLFRSGICYDCFTLSIYKVKCLIQKNKESPPWSKWDKAYTKPHQKWRQNPYNHRAAIRLLYIESKETCNASGILCLCSFRDKMQGQLKTQQTKSVLPVIIMTKDMEKTSMLSRFLHIVGTTVICYDLSPCLPHCCCHLRASRVSTSIISRLLRSLKSLSFGTPSTGDSLSPKETDPSVDASAPDVVAKSALVVCRSVPNCSRTPLTGRAFEDPLPLGGVKGFSPVTAISSCRREINSKIAATRRFISSIEVRLGLRYRGLLDFPDSPFIETPFDPLIFGESLPMPSPTYGEWGEWLVSVPLPLAVSRSLVYWFLPTRPPLRAGGRPVLRVDGRGIGSCACTGVPGFGSDVSGSFAVGFVGEAPSSSESVDDQT